MSNLCPSEGIKAITERIKAAFPKTPKQQRVLEKEAAVLVPLFEDKSKHVQVWLTKRSSVVSTHKGEVCLPGGRKELADADSTETATREAYEEIGLPTADVDILGTMEPLVTKHGLFVTPVIGIVNPGFEPEACSKEVDSIFHVPLDIFLQSRTHYHKDVAWNGINYRVHFFDEKGYTIWGLTAAALIKVAKVAYGCRPEFDEFGNGTDYTSIMIDDDNKRINSPKM